jgi:hypothetical protein
MLILLQLHHEDAPKLVRADELDLKVEQLGDGEELGDSETEVGEGHTKGVERHGKGGRVATSSRGSAEDLLNM